MRWRLGEHAVVGIRTGQGARVVVRQVSRRLAEGWNGQESEVVVVAIEVRREEFKDKAGGSCG